MMAQGTDGISREDMLEGVMAGKLMLEFIPLDKGACERCVKLEGWTKSWLGQDIIFLKASDWFELNKM